LVYPQVMVLRLRLLCQNPRRLSDVRSML
jgi:hypothetical protein